MAMHRALRKTLPYQPQRNTITEPLPNLRRSFAGTLLWTGTIVIRRCKRMPVTALYAEDHTMRIERAREQLIKQAASFSEGKVMRMLTWMRRRRTGDHRRKQTSRQEFEGHLASMTNADVKEMVAETQQKRPRNLASLIRLPTLVLKMIARMTGWRHTDKQPR